MLSFEARLSFLGRLASGTRWDSFDSHQPLLILEEGHRRVFSPGSGVLEPWLVDIFRQQCRQEWSKVALFGTLFD